MFSKTVRRTVEAVEGSTEPLLITLDENAWEVFMSNFGFYAGLAAELRLSKIESCVSSTHHRSPP